MIDSGWPIVGVIGARGVVGGVFLSILSDAGLPADRLRAFGHEGGTTTTYGDTEVPVSVLTDAAADELDVLFVAVGADESRELMARLEDFLKFLLPAYQREGKAYLTVAIGCTGGRHRSVAVAEELKRYLDALGVSPGVVHRDIERE